jgi:hypothetical protein
MALKESVYDSYMQMLHNKICMLQQRLLDLKESGANETKSTAGDKHETALAMLQIEQENIRAQLHTALEDLAILKNINPSIISKQIVNGSLVKTSKGYFFISIALGKNVIDGITVYALSQQSPLGAKLMGLNIGDSAYVNSNIYLVEAIL